jgi:RNA polymerase sigma-70 factor (sigma-E family)
VSGRRDDEFTEYVTERMWWLRRLAYLLCQDWLRADDLVQATITRLYTHWGRAAAVEHTDGYVRTILVREYLSERRSGWARRVSLTAEPPDTPSVPGDREGSLDLRAALAGLPLRQRATLVLRFYCDLNVDQAAQLLGCSPGTVKSQTAKGISALRRELQSPGAPEPPGRGPGADPDGMEVQAHG